LKSALRQALIVLLCYAAAVLATPFLVILCDNVISLWPNRSSSNPDDLFEFVLVGAMITGIYAAAPFLAAIGLMRWWRRRDWLIHAIFGVVVAYLAMSIFTKPFTPDLQHAAFLSAGFGSGLVYWLCRRPFGWAWA
jgi:uncharacterized BrkB/YihY/UPF0761 family membrane protein